MKVLFITPYITSNAHCRFMKNKTGFGLMVYDIAKHIGEDVDVDVFPVNTITPEMRLDTFKTIGRSWPRFLLNISLSSFFDAFKFLKRYKLSFKESLRVLYQFLSIAQVERLFESYDLVHVHGCSPITYSAINACNRKNIPFVVTLHGLVSFEKSVRLSDSLKQYERDFLIESYLNDYNVTFISSGIKQQAETFIKNIISKK